MELGAEEKRCRVGCSKRVEERSGKPGGSHRTAMSRTRTQITAWDGVDHYGKELYGCEGRRSILKRETKAERLPSAVLSMEIMDFSRFVPSSNSTRVIAERQTE